MCRSRHLGFVENNASDDVVQQYLIANASRMLKDYMRIVSEISESVMKIFFVGGANETFH